MSNRLHCPLYDENGKLIENLVIRSKHLYSCVRMLIKLLQVFQTGGSIVKRHTHIKWDDLWKACCSSYETQYNDDSWIIVYHNGKALFRDGHYHPFLDMVEKYAPLDGETHENYDRAIHHAEKAFRDLGKPFTIKHDRNIAMMLSTHKQTIRCSNTVRRHGKTNTFSFTCTLDAKHPNITNFAPFMAASASYAEAIQLTFTLGRLMKQSFQGNLEDNLPEKRYLQDTQRRVDRLKAEITNMETSHKVRYRPERPNLDQMIKDAQIAG